MPATPGQTCTASCVVKSNFWLPARHGHSTLSYNLMALTSTCLDVPNDEVALLHNRWLFDPQAISKGNFIDNCFVSLTVSYGKPILNETDNRILSTQI